LPSSNLSGYYSQLGQDFLVTKFFEGAESLGVSTFTIDDAKKAQTKNLEKFPRNMLFARAISNGARWYCPDIFGGSPVYTPDEMGMSVDEDGYVDGEIVEQAPLVALIAPYTYSDGEKVSDAGRDVFDKFKKWHGRIPASRDEMGAWYRQKDAQAPTTPPVSPSAPTDKNGVPYTTSAAGIISYHGDNSVAAIENLLDDLERELEG
jgi:hypothetical protein